MFKPNDSGYEGSIIYMLHTSSAHLRMSESLCNDSNGIYIYVYAEPYLLSDSLTFK